MILFCFTSCCEVASCLSCMQCNWTNWGGGSNPKYTPKYTFLVHLILEETRLRAFNYLELVFVSSSCPRLSVLNASLLRVYFRKRLLPRQLSPCHICLCAVHTCTRFRWRSLLKWVVLYWIWLAVLLRVPFLPLKKKMSSHFFFFF